MRPQHVISLALIAGIGNSVAQDWPQWMGPKRDGIYAGKVSESAPKAGWKARWKIPIGAGYAGPAVAEGHVFLSDRIASETSSSTTREGKERVLCIDEQTGKVKWERSWEVAYQIDYGAGPRATPTISGDFVYVQGAEGHLRCLEKTTGKTVWEKSLTTTYGCKPPTWGYAAHPMIWKGMLITLAGGEGSAAVALDAATGAEKWRSLSSGQIGYCSPMIMEHHGRTDALVWTADNIHGIDPTTGKELWSIPWSIRFGVSIANPRQVGSTVLVSNFWPGAKLLQLKPDGSKPEILWETEKASDKNTTHLNALMCTPMPRGEHVFGVCSYGQLRCLHWMTGRREWETFQATGGEELRWGTAFLTQIGESSRYFIFNEQGELILASLTPEKYTELHRQKVIEPNCGDIKERKLVWSHPAYANGACFARNDTELVCIEIP